MSIWRKLKSQAARFADSGPLSLLAAAFSGERAEAAGAGENADGKAFGGQQDIAFTIGVIALGAKMAKADGVVTADEVAAFKQVFHVPAEEMRNVGRVFDLARRDVAGYESYARQIANLFAGQGRMLEDLLHCLFHIAAADGVIHPAERAYLRNVAAIFKIAPADFERIRAHYGDQDDEDCYAVLGVSPDLSDDALKQAYHKLVRDNHPDRMLADGVPAEFVQLADRKLAAINHAYDQIMAHRRSDRSEAS